MKNSSSFQVTTPSDREIAIHRAFDAPRPMVYEALTRPELLRRWLTGPPGWTMTECENDVRVGGRYRFVWSHADGANMGLGGTYLEVSPPGRYVATEKFDESWYPGEARVTTVLAEAGVRTLLTLTILYESKEARDVALKSGMESGMAYGYDQLEAVVAALAAGGSGA